MINLLSYSIHTGGAKQILNRVRGHIKIQTLVFIIKPMFSYQSRVLVHANILIQTVMENNLVRPLFNTPSFSSLKFNNDSKKQFCSREKDLFKTTSNLENIYSNSHHIFFTELREMDNIIQQMDQKLFVNSPSATYLELYVEC